MELNGALWNPLEKRKTGFSRLRKLVRDLREREVSRTRRSIPPRRELVGAAAEEIVCTADAPFRIDQVCAVLRERGVAANPASVRKALHDRSRGAEARLQRVGRGIYAATRVTAAKRPDSPRPNSLGHSPGTMRPDS
jgi:hypothetical protein